MSNVLFQTIDQISREKGIDPSVVVHAIEDAIVVAVEHPDGELPPKIGNPQ